MRKNEKAARGQNLRTETAPDRSSLKQDDTEALMGKKCGGGPRDLSHSLMGNKSVDFMDTPPKPRK